MLTFSLPSAVALRRAYPDAFDDDGFDFESGTVRLPRPLSAPASPRFTSGMMTPGDLATLTEEMQGLGTSDYNGAQTVRSLPFAFLPSFTTDLLLSCCSGSR